MSEPETSLHCHADADAHFRRKPSAFRSTISRDPDAEFPAQENRYVLYLNYGCPWAHRTNLGLEGWFFLTPIMKADTRSPCWLWDSQKETIVNDESGEIIRMFYTEFDELLPYELREANHPSGGYFPPHLRVEIDAMTE
ncbi:uncharacterized protein BP01DRAFT_394708 [Aspergillus saccharolyticus JOP 1030-1]|uniref:GST N-terminal domain-containing protein n=1 Tax=Aspergillus saccharolyticus JOP 1030-1 TaxID=1450539 RepID=A0A318Z5Y6_9EURO|nr:hypothetical protein BP01DRAFT_394708 [Aspergillus saccharolyticus JOP 1030-1]PYH41864.1 hypothetical protein BP01DRAFT_394708 [Aspergillus saccharolyticus JOP 1030-1]